MLGAPQNVTYKVTLAHPALCVVRVMASTLCPHNHSSLWLSVHSLPLQGDVAASAVDHQVW